MQCERLGCLINSLFNQFGREQEPALAIVDRADRQKVFPQALWYIADTQLFQKIKRSRVNSLQIRVCERFVKATDLTGRARIKCWFGRALLHAFTAPASFPALSCHGLCAASPDRHR